jgi:hypothetical protein
VTDEATIAIWESFKPFDLAEYMDDNIDAKIHKLVKIDKEVKKNGRTYNG